MKESITVGFNFRRILFSLVIILCCFDICRAQQYTPYAYISVSVPVNISSRYIDTRYKLDERNTSHYVLARELVFQSSQFTNFSVKDSLVVGTYSDHTNPSVPYDYSISLFFDSSKKKLGRFILRYETHYYTLHKRVNKLEYYSFSNLVLNESDTGVFLAIDSGAIVKARLDSVYVTNNSYETFSTGEYTNTDATYTSVFDDSSAFKYSLSIDLYAGSKQRVVGATQSTDNIKVRHGLFSNLISFDFGTMSHSTTLYLYDELGRIVRQIEIPSGSSEFTVPDGEFKPGYYFARVGSHATGFVVN